MHYLLKKEGLHAAGNIDSGIAMSFCDMNKSVKNQLKLQHSPVVEEPVLKSKHKRGDFNLAPVNKTDSH